MRAPIKAKLHDTQRRVWEYPSRFKVVTAGRRWGKTNLAKVACGVKAASKKKCKVWYVAPSYTMAKGIMWEELKDFIPREWLAKTPNETELKITLVNGSTIECKGADKPDSLRGVGLYFVVLDEFQDMKPDTWTKVIRPTLAKDRGEAMIIGTPKGYANLYDVHVKGQAGGHPSWKSWQFPTITSPFISESEIEEARQEMDEKSFRQEFMASFETMSGRVYYPFDRNVHVGEYPFNPQLPIWVGQDFNIDPMSSVILQPQPDGSVWAVDELYIRNSNTLEVCENLEQRYWRYMGKSPHQIIVFPDPAGSARQHARGDSDIDMFREKGFTAVRHRRKHPAVADRVNAMNRMLMSANGDIRFRVNSSCKNLINSLEQTMYKEGSREIDKRPGIEHMTDACGYPMEFNFPSKELIIAGASL